MLEHPIKADSMSTTWLSGGVPHSVTTMRNPGETTAAWRARHFSDVTTAQGTWPPD